MINEQKTCSECGSGITGDTWVVEIDGTENSLCSVLCVTASLDKAGDEVNAHVRRERVTQALIS